MTPQEKTIVKLLIAVAWADGEMQAPETGVIEGLLSGFDASPTEEKELIEYARSPRTLRDVPVADLSADDRETLMRNAALLVHSDDEETLGEQTVLEHLADVLEIGKKETAEIVASVRLGMKHLNRGDS
ncbi:MAG: hypothetical protein ABI175_00065 [Polyangiales bacterium]